MGRQFIDIVLIRSMTGLLVTEPPSAAVSVAQRLRTPTTSTQMRKWVDARDYRRFHSKRAAPEFSTVRIHGAVEMIGPRIGWPQRAIPKRYYSGTQLCTSSLLGTRQEQHGAVL